MFSIPLFLRSNQSSLLFILGRQLFYKIKSFILRPLSWLSVIMMAALVLSPLADAAKRTLGISESVFKEMQKAQTLASEEKYAQAREVVVVLLKNNSLNEYEQAQAYSIYGSIYYQEGDYAAAYRALEKAIQYERIPDGFIEANLRSLAQLALAIEEYQSALTYLQRLKQMFQQADATIDALIARTYLSLGNYAKALEFMHYAIENERGVKDKVREDWLLMLSSIYYALEQYEDMIPVLQELISNYPKVKYVVNLAAIYGQLDDTKQQLLLLEPLYEQGEITRETLLLTLSNLYMLHGTPIKSARLLSRHMGDDSIEKNQRNYELLAQAWQLAQETELAIEPLKRAGQLSSDGNLSLRLAQIYMYLYDWQNAEVEFERALKKGGLSDEGNVLLLLGMTQYYQEKYTRSLETLSLATDFEGTEALAKQWFAYVSNEQEKFALYDADAVDY